MTPEQALKNIEAALKMARFPNNSGQDILIAFNSLQVLRGVVEAKEASEPAPPPDQT